MPICTGTDPKPRRLPWWLAAVPPVLAVLLLAVPLCVSVELNLQVAGLVGIWGHTLGSRDSRPYTRLRQGFSHLVFSPLFHPGHSKPSVGHGWLFRRGNYVYALFFTPR